MRLAIFISVLLTTFVSLPALSQDGCTNSLACNYDPDATIDDGSCLFEDWYIPESPSTSLSEPALFTCLPPAGYMAASNWGCMDIVLNANPDCASVDWDGACHDLYCTCAGGLGCTDSMACNFNPTAVCDDGSCIPMVCGNPSGCNYVPGGELDPCANDLGCVFPDWYIPTDLSLGLPAIESCTDPGPDYVLAPNQQCALTVISNDNYCITNLWDSICEDAYCDCVGRTCNDPSACNFDSTGDLFCHDPTLCAYPQWYLPQDVTGSFPAVQACSPPSGYYLADDQTCAQTVVDNPLFYMTNWDDTSLGGYCQCSGGDGCTDPAACNFDSTVLCDDGSCSYGVDEWYIPIYWWLSSNDPAVLTCTAPDGYMLATCQDCVYDMFGNLELSSTDWDENQALIYCVYTQVHGQMDLEHPCVGCSIPTSCNYNPFAVIDDFETCGFPDCADPAACNYNSNPLVCHDPFLCDFCEGWALPDVIGTNQPAVYVTSSAFPAGYSLAPNQACVQSVIDLDPYCVDTNWDQICQDAYLACAGAPGCTQLGACNYDPAASFDDGSCFFGILEWWLPDVVDSGNQPALFTCGTPTGYHLAESQACVETALSAFPQAQYVDWSSEANYLYLNCAGGGCTDATAANFDSLALVDDGSCEYANWYLPYAEGLGPAIYDSAPPNGYFLANQACMTALGPPLECQYFDWYLCHEDYSCCVNPGAMGCTDALAANYSPIACVDDGTCVFVNSVGCPTDLDNSCDTNTADLLIMLTAFGQSCPNCP